MGKTILSAPWYLSVITLLFLVCALPPIRVSVPSASFLYQQVAEPPAIDYSHHFVVPRAIPVEGYFSFVDSVVAAYDSLVDYPLTEHILVHANPWIIDTLSETDYYRQMKRGKFVYDQRKAVVLRSGDTLRIPSRKEALTIQRYLRRTALDVNIPEFLLRIWVERLGMAHTPGTGG